MGRNKMDITLRPIFSVLNVPEIKIKRPSWLQTPSPYTVFAFVLVSYFLVTGGIIYDVIVEPPSVGSTTDEQVNLVLEPKEGCKLKDIRRKYLRCSSLATIIHLKKFIALKCL